MKQKYFKIFLIIILLVIIDQFTKFLVINNLNNNLNIINNFLEFVFVKNTGAAFGIFNKNIFLLTMVTILFIIYLFFELFNKKNTDLSKFSLILIISGSIGNLIDRVFLKYVVDFIHFRIFNISMPVFNVADILITFGVIIYIYSMVKGEVNEKNNSR